MFTNAMRKTKAHAKGIRQRKPFGGMEQLETRDLLSVSVERTSLNLRFSIDYRTKERPDCEYQTFKVTNNEAATLNNVWFQLVVNDPNQSVQLAPNEDGLYFLGDLMPGDLSAKTAFIYLRGKYLTPAEQPFEVHVWKNGPPGTGTEVSLTPMPADYTRFQWVAGSEGNDDGSKTYSVTTTYHYGGSDTTGPVVGGTMTMFVTGQVKRNADRILYSPATDQNWPADTFVLEAVQVKYPGSSPAQLPPNSLFEKPIVGNPKDFTAEYTFRIEGTTATATPVTAREWTAVGPIEVKRTFDHSRLVGKEVPIPPAVSSVSITKTADTGTVVAGSSSEHSFSITVRNTSSTVDLTDVVVDDTWPVPFLIKQFSGDDTPPQVIGTDFRWTLPTLPHGSSKTLMVTYTVPTTTTLGKYTNRSTVTSIGGAPVSLPASADVTVVDVPLKIAKVGDAERVKAGTSGHWYKITVTNTSTQFAAENVKVVDTWPTAFAWTTPVPPFGTITVDSTGFRWDIPSLAKNTSVVLTVNFSVPSGTPAQVYSNFATLTSDTQNLVQNVQADTVVLSAGAQAGVIVCTDDGCDPAWVRVLDENGNLQSPQSQFQPYGNIRGGLRVVAADVNGDGIDEVIVAPGVGVAGPVKVLTTTGAPVPGFPDFYPYGPTWRSGVELAAAYINKDLREDIITGMSLGVGTVNVYLANGGLSLFRSFRGVPTGYAGGVRIAAADFGTYLNGALVDSTPDGKAEVVVGTNAGITAQVRIFDVQPTTPVLARTIVPFGTAFTGGVSVSTGNYDNDPAKIPEIFVGAGIGGQSRVKVFNAQTGMLSPNGDINVFSTSFAKPNAVVNVAPVDTNFDGTIDTLYGVQGKGGAGGTKGILRVTLPSTKTSLTTYAPPMRIAPIVLSSSLLSRAAGARPR